MPYIDTTPIDTYLRIDEDNAIEQIGQLLVDNGWTFVKSFSKVATDTRAYHRAGERRTAYAFAEHFIYRNAEGRLLGMANSGFYSIYFKTDYGETIRRPYDERDEEDDNFGITPAWENWARQKLADNTHNNRIYFYMLEKAPSNESVPQGKLITTVVMPGMSKTRIDPGRDRDEGNYVYNYDWSTGSNTVKYQQLDKNGEDLEFNGKILSASEEYLMEAALDIEVHGTTWIAKDKEVRIDYAEPRIMQSPIVEVALRSDLIEYVSNPIHYTNWWTDSEIRLKGYIDSKTINVIIQADSAPKYDGNIVPNIPIYFGKIVPINGKELDEFEPGYALFGGGVPDAYNTASLSRKQGTYIHSHNSDNWARVSDMTTLGGVGTLIKVGNHFFARITDFDTLEDRIRYEVLELTSGKEYSGNTWHFSTSRRVRKALESELPSNIKAMEEVAGTTLTGDEDYSLKTEVPISENTSSSDYGTLAAISKYDFDTMKDLKVKPKMPILKTYNEYPSDGVFSVMCSKTRFGARYQRHYLSWGTASNDLPPAKNLDGKKYEKAYDQMEKTLNYKYQFNDSRYSNKVHATPIYIVHPEDGVRGQLEHTIGFNPQSISNSMLRVRVDECPVMTYDMYAPNVVNAVSPLTKLPATAFRPVGYGIFKEHSNPFLESYDKESDLTPPNPVVITRVDTSHERTVLVEWEVPTDQDFFGVNIYVNGRLYAKNVSGIQSYLVAGFSAEDEVVVEIESIDLAGNVSTKVTTEPVIIQ